MTSALSVFVFFFFLSFFPDHSGAWPLRFSATSILHRFDGPPLRSSTTLVLRCSDPRPFWSSVQLCMMLCMVLSMLFVHVVVHAVERAGVHVVVHTVEDAVEHAVVHAVVHAVAHTVVHGFCACCCACCRVCCLCMLWWRSDARHTPVPLGLLGTRSIQGPAVLMRNARSLLRSIVQRPVTPAIGAPVLGRSGQ